MSEERANGEYLSTDLFSFGDRVRFLVNVPKMHPSDAVVAGDVGEIIGVHPHCGPATYTVRLDKMRRALGGTTNVCTGAAPEEIEKENRD